MATLQPSPHHAAFAAAPPRQAASILPVYVAATLAYLLLLPPQLNLSIAGSAMPPYRFLLIGASLWLVLGALRRDLRWHWPDLLIIATVSWICLAMANSSPWETALTGSIAHLVDIGLAYFFARAALRSLRDLRMFLILLLPGLVLVGAALVLESVTKTHIIQGLFSQLTGRPIGYGSDFRLGLMRAQGPFPHPILAGIFFSSFLPIYWLAGFKLWPRLLGALAAVCSMFTISSAAILSLFATIVLLAYNWLGKRFANLSWSLFFGLTCLLLFAAEFGTQSGLFRLFARFASLNADSSYTRILIWEYGSRNVARHPWFGIGYAEWERAAWMGTSIDNYWMLLAVRFGVLPPLLIALAVVLGVVMVIRKSMTSVGADRDLERGLAIALAVMALGLISVALWLSAQVWLFMLLGLTVSLASVRTDATTHR
jgi:hypothetical protein